MVTLTNEDFLDRFPSIDKLDSLSAEKLKSKKLSCIPQNFGYGIEEGEIIFPYTGYPDCREKFPDGNRISIDFSTNLLAMNCTGEYPGRFVTGPNGNKRIGLRDEFEWEEVEYLGHPMEVADTVEFALGTCNPDSGALFD